MGTSEPIKLRAHHLKELADHYFKLIPFGKREFLEKIIANPEQKIELVENQSDAICAECYKTYRQKVDDDCIGKRDVASYLTDRLAAKLLGLNLGETYTFKDLTKVFSDKAKLIRQWSDNLLELTSEHLHKCPAYVYCPEEFVSVVGKTIMLYYQGQ